MSTFKKLLALTLALAMVLSVSAFAGNYKADTYADADKIDSDCEDAVELMYALDIMVGDGKNFNPQSTVTRAEMAKMIYVILNYGDDDKAANYTGAKIFSDIEAGTWYEGYVNYCGTTKLVQGRPDGTFGPMDPVTCAEAAKMLLTAIGYSAEDRGYTGPNWAKNVLADAAIVDLLDDYKYNTNTYAPRQWVAVMFENALLKAYTYTSVRPVSVNGLLTSSMVGRFDEDDVETMGEKYYDLDQYTGYLYATPNAYIDRVVTEREEDEKKKNYDEPTDWLEPSKNSYTTADDYVMLSNGDDNDYLIVETDEVGVYDLGQQFRVIYDSEDDVVYSITATGKSDTYEAMVKDLAVEVVHKNDNNDEANRYEFTVGDFEGKFDSKIKAAELWSKNDFHYGEYGVADIYDAIGEEQFVRTDLVKVIDRNGDGDIEYAIYTAYDYAKVASVKTQKYHGDYITAKKLINNEYLTYGKGDTKLYLDEVITTSDDIAKNDYIKYTWDYDQMCYSIEVMEAETATYEFKSKRDVYTFSGEDYLIAYNGIAGDGDPDIYSNVEDKKKDKEYNILVDDNLLIKVWADADDMSLEDLNGKLALLIGVTTTYDTGFYSDSNGIRFLTIEGGNEYIDAPYYMGVDDAADEDGELAVEWAEIETMYLPNNKKEADLTDYALTGKTQLFILHTLDSGKVWLEEIAADGDVIADTEDELVYDLVNYKPAAELDVADGSVGVKDVTVANTFFVGIESDDEVEYKVMTLEELGDVTASLVHSEFILDDGVVDDILGGYALIDGTKLNGDGATGYAWIADDVTVGGSKNNKFYTDLLTKDELIENVRIKFADTNGSGTTELSDLNENALFWYEYDLDNEYYVLTEVAFAPEADYDDDFGTNNNWSEIVKFDETEIWYEKYNSNAFENDDKYFSVDVEDYTIALKVFLQERNEDDELYEVETFVMFTTLADLKEGNVTIETREIEDVEVIILDGESDDTFNFLSDSKMVHSSKSVKDLVLIEVQMDEITKQP